MSVGLHDGTPTGTKSPPSSVATTPTTGSRQGAGSLPKLASPSRDPSKFDEAAWVEEEDELLLSPTLRYTIESLRKQQVKMLLTGDKKTKESPESSPLKPGAWHVRRSRVADSGFDQQAPPAMDPRSTKLPSSIVSDTGRVKATSSPTSASRFSFFNITARKSTAPPPVTTTTSDDLVNLDISKALFPAGVPSEKDAFSPSAYKNLQMNAIGLLYKFQAAYRDKSVACQELRAEREAQQDEKLENETRTTHLKMQLEDMARKAAEAEASIQALMEEVKSEKKSRAEERAGREAGAMSSGMSTISEDLGAEDDQRKKYRRRSGGTTKSYDAFDTDDESIDEVSVFSRSRSPTLAASMSEPPNSLESVSRQSLSNPPALPPVPRSAATESSRASRQPQTQVSAFQRLFKGNSGDVQAKDGHSRAVHGCENCKGQDASVAWDTASLLRDENRGLKQRVSQLEDAVEDALDAVMGVSM